MKELFQQTKAAFELPEGVIYLDGNSLGPMTHASRARMQDELDNQWSQKLIRGWNESGWYHLSQTVGNKIARIIGVSEGTVTAGDSTSLNTYKLLSAALKLNPERKVILTDSGNFPTDMYVAQGLIADKAGYELRVVEPEQVLAALNEDVAVAMITQVDYCSGRLHDMAEITARCKQLGVLSLWDLCHSAGALELELEALGVDFAVGCGYKYLNGGPGAPAFLYVRRDLIEQIQPALTGWMGHASPFSFAQQYQPVPGIERMRVGTPQVLGLACLDAALSVWEGVELRDIRARAIELSELFIREVEQRCPQLELVSPRDSAQRGSQVSFAHPEAYAVVQALIAQGVIGDFRMPNIARFGITPLYLDEGDILRAAEVLEDVMTHNRWDCDEFKRKHAVT